MDEHSEPFLKVVEFKPRQPIEEKKAEEYILADGIVEHCEKILEGVKSGKIRNITFIYTDDSEPEYPFAYQSSAWWHGWAGHQKLCHALAKANFRSQQRLFNMEDSDYEQR